MGPENEATCSCGRNRPSQAHPRAGLVPDPGGCVALAWGSRRPRQGWRDGGHGPTAANAAWNAWRWVKGWDRALGHGGAEEGGRWLDCWWAGREQSGPDPQT